MESLLQQQYDIVEAIKKLERNFNKDTASRKTRKYLDERLDALDKLWAEFQVNDQKMSHYKHDTDKEPYFDDDQFTQARTYFDSVRIKISSFPPATETTAPPASAGLPKFAQHEPTATAGPSKPLPRFMLPTTPTVPATFPLDQGQPAELLTQQRTNFRAFHRQVNSLNVDTIQDKWELEDELRNIQTRWNAIDALHLQIDNILQGSNTQYDDEFYAYEDSYKAVKKALNLKLASTAHRQQSTPQIEIPTFTGKYTQWPTFFDLYVESIHDNNILSNTQKMQHLKSKLRGDAERLIQHLHISADNYETAWELLTHRYNNPQMLFTKQIEIFINQPAVHKQSAYEIRRLYDTSMECIHAIQNLGIDTHTWDPILVHLIAKKLDVETYSDYKEARKSPRDLPSLSELMDFLESKFIALEPLIARERESATSSNKLYQHKPTYNKSYKFNSQQSTAGQRYGKFQGKEFQAIATCSSNCPICNSNHYIYKCNNFRKMTPDERLMTVMKLNFCHNCLYTHNDNQCTSTKRCRVCQNNHNTLLHGAYANVNLIQKSPNKSTEAATPSHVPTAPITQNTSIPLQPYNKQHSVNHVATADEEILLTTLSIKVKAADDTYVTLRALLDQGSQISLISENAAQMLGLPRQRYHASVSGIGNGSKHGKGVVTLACQSIYQDYEFTTEALVIKHVINNLPNISFSKQSWPHLQHIQLADPEYNVSKPIDLLLDASVYSDIIMSGLTKGPKMAPIAQQTRLGWVLSGNVKTFKCHVVINNLSDITQYWELEDINNSATELSPGEEYCETYYQSTTTRLPTGRYEVAIPMKPGFEQDLGQSKPKAVAQYHNLEHKMSKNEEFADTYKNFLREYEEQGHMSPVTQHIEPSCYLPHHGVLKIDSTTTKLRTVFNASSKTSSGHSLNDLMERGPNLQKDLQHLILVWRQHRYVITADIEKMFRQIMIRESDQHLQRIVWRSTPAEPLKEYQLATITYGTKAAPYLAMRTLKQLATDDADKFPLAAAALKTSFYMDDLLEGCDTISEAKQLQQELIDILQGAGMNIRKWSSNTCLLLEDLPAAQLDAPLDFKDSENRKTLGLRWNPISDTFTFKNMFQDETSNAAITKRHLLSLISKVFDPLGWLSPLTVRAKLLFQRTWAEQTADWDTLLNENLHKEWLQLRHDLQDLENFNIPRYLGDKQHYSLHGFCDASEKLYACAIYVITCNSKGDFTSTLMIAKTKLAPLKNKLSLPKLELCGALLLSQLMKKVLDTLPGNVQTYAWTDSMVVLGWLHGDINRWKQFVANRVQTILNTIPSSSWHHVRSEENAADCATRGLTSLQLSEHSLWWHGPQWLSTFDPDMIKDNIYQPTTLEAKKTSVNAAVSHVNDLVIRLLYECSSTRRITTTIGWLSRFIQWLRNKQTLQERCLSTSELQLALNLIIKSVQLIEFNEDIDKLQNHGKLKNGSKLLSLNPYIDASDGLLKVGGRLNNSRLNQSAKHPIILPSYSKLTELIIQQAHSATLHGGPSLTLSFIREKYWILSGLRTVKRELRKCVKCRRFQVEKRTQIMADLPEPRVTPSRPFTHTGVDFTGHFDIKANKGRGVRTNKGYVAVFVCMSTKAVHLELVSDLSTPGFLAAFRRFCARRSVPQHMYSDQGRNFIGASKELKKEYKEILRTIDFQVLTNINEYDIQWHFNVAAFPSAGGIWESSVKSMKHHLRRVIGQQKLTYEEFTTLLYQIEACLNSRPLLALNENPDNEYLSPGHFLVGGPLLSRPQTDPDHMNLNTKWRLIQAINKQFWKKWSSDYLQQLQVRTKWQTPSKNIEVDDIVLIKDDNLAPGKWAMGKVIDVHPGKDGYVRVVTLKTKNGIMKRPILKLSILPVKEERTPQQAGDAQSSTCDNSAPINTQPDQPRSRRSTRRQSGSILTIAMTMFMLLFTPVQCSYNISTFNDNQNLYFDKMYDMNLIRDEWNLIVYYNMSTYWSALRHVQNYVSHLEDYLHTTALPTQYKSIIYQMQHELSEINHYNRILKSHANKRHKRGLVDGVGYLANSLFGVLDERFAKKYEKDIEKISMNENHLQKLLKNQTSVIEAQYNILQRHEAIMNKQFGLVQTYLNNVTQGINRMQAITNSELHILSSSMSAIIIISNIRNMQENIINTVTDLVQGHMDAHLLPPEQLAEQINIIYSHIPNDLTLPADKQDFKELYKLLKISGDIGSSYLIIEIKIPLVNKETLELDKVISLPAESYVVEFIAPYIAFNLQKDLLLPLTETDVQGCVHTHSNKLLCSINRPIYELQISQSICNLSIHNKTFCSAKDAPCHERWIKLHQSNRWLFSCCGNCAVRIFCTDSGMTMKTLIGNGIIEIGQGCTIKGEIFSILGHNDYISHVEVQGSYQLLSETSVLNSILNATDFKPFITENHEDEWRQMKAQISSLKEQENAPLSVHDVHQYSVLYLILILLIAGGGIYVIIRWRKNKGTFNMVSTDTTAIAIPMTASADQHNVAPRTRPRTVRLDIPVTSVL